MIGARHRLSGLAVQDSYAWAVEEEWVVVAVADGVGSLADSAGVADAAAATACQAAARSLAGGFPGLTAVEAGVAAANDAARAAAEVEPGATTLAVAAVSVSGEVAAARVGDSDARVLCGGAWVSVFSPDPSDADPFVATTTDALPSDAPVLDTASAALAAGDALVLVTDGLAQPLDDGPSTVAPTLAAALSTPVAPLTLAGLIDFSRQGCHDDRTIAVVWLRGSPEPDRDAGEGLDNG